MLMLMLMLMLMELMELMVAKRRANQSRTAGKF